MRLITLARPLLLLAVALALPTAALAQFDLTVNPDRLDFEGVTFFDVDEGVNNQLLFDVDGRAIGLSGTVVGNAGGDIVTIRYQTDFPNSSSASNQAAAVQQDNQVRITLEIEVDATLVYFGQAAPNRCKVSGKLRDNEAGDPDEPDNAQASLSCNLRSGWQELDSDDVPQTPGDPSTDELLLVEQAFTNRKDVQVDTNGGQLVIKHKGEAAN
jgi:hypothetical protein